MQFSSANVATLAVFMVGKHFEILNFGISVFNFYNYLCLWSVVCGLWFLVSGFVVSWIGGLVDWWIAPPAPPAPPKKTTLVRAFFGAANFASACFEA